MLKICLHYLISFALIIGCLWVGNTIQTLFNLSIPGSIFGMLLLFLLLASGIIPSKWVESGARLFIRYMIILFVPISVGLMNHFDTIANHALAIIASSIGGTLLVLLVLSVSLDRFLKRK